MSSETRIKEHACMNYIHIRRTLEMTFQIKLLTYHKS
jgi:hypothetical protein